MILSGLPLPRWVSLRRVRVYLLVIVCGWLTLPELAQAKAVNLIAPKEVREVLAKYFVLPDTLLKNENERAIFMSRAQREIPELLVTEGYFSSKVILQFVSRAGVLELEVIPGPVSYTHLRAHETRH